MSAPTSSKNEQSTMLAQKRMQYGACSLPTARWLTPVRLGKSGLKVSRIILYVPIHIRADMQWLHV